MSDSRSSFDKTERKAREWWNSWAKTFHEEYGDGDIPVGIAFGPGAPHDDDLGLLGPLDGTDAIELGCGGAQFGIGVSKRGADVTGVDLSEEQLSYARTNAAEHDQEIEFIHGSVTDLSTIPAESFDLAFSAFVFQWVEDIQACFEEAYRILKDDGKLVFSVDHPYYKILDPETHDIKTSYFAESPRKAYSEKFDAEMVIYRRGVGETVQRLTDAGFTVETIREPGYDDPAAYESEFGSFEPELMAKVPPTIIYSASKSATHD
jgi:ubiquinone/menaquinone biosynthesis C-methylase UbiE